MNGERRQEACLSGWAPPNGPATGSIPLGHAFSLGGTDPLNIGSASTGAGAGKITLSNLTIALHRYGARLEDLVKTSVYVVGDRQDLVAVWEVVADGLAPFRPPSTLLGVSLLGYPGQLVEIEGVAALPARG